MARMRMYVRPSLPRPPSRPAAAPRRHARRDGGRDGQRRKSGGERERARAYLARDTRPRSTTRQGSTHGSRGSTGVVSLIVCCGWNAWMHKDVDRDLVRGPGFVDWSGFRPFGPDFGSRLTDSAL
eukprot:scaffold7843_cov108-Isochrysis_galbana.AAC.4